MVRRYIRGRYIVICSLSAGHLLQLRNTAGGEGNGYPGGAAIGELDSRRPYPGARDKPISAEEPETGS